MKRKATKVYYAVRRGRKPGVYSKWKDCFAQTKHFPRAEFMKFKTFGAAEIWLANAIEKPNADVNDRSFFDVYTDGSLKPATGQMGYGAWFKTDDGVEHGFFRHASEENLRADFNGVVARSKKSSSLVEMCAAVHILRLLKGKHRKIRIHADNEGVRCWYNGSWKAKQPGIATLLVNLKDATGYFDRVDIVSVKGHSGNYGNDCADKLANRGAENAEGQNKIFIYKKN